HDAPREALDEGLAEHPHEAGERDPVHPEFLQSPGQGGIEVGPVGERGMVDRLGMQAQAGGRIEARRTGAVRDHRDDARGPGILATTLRELDHVGATARDQHGDFFHRAILAPGIAPTLLRKPYNSTFCRTPRRPRPWTSSAACRPPTSALTARSRSATTMASIAATRRCSPASSSGRDGA